MKIKSFECPKSIRNYEKKYLGMSDAWWMSRLFHRPSEPVYYIVDCRISALLGSTAPAKYRFYAKLKVCMQARQGFGSSEFAHHGAACKIIDKLNPAGVCMSIFYLFSRG